MKPFETLAQLPVGTTISPVTAYRCLRQKLSTCNFYCTVAVGAKNAANISPCAVIRDSLWE
jgi:hypothetical protein